MKTRASSSSLYERATPVVRKAMREFALSKPCPDCKALPGEMCRSMSGIVAAPHWVRRKDFKIQP